MSVLPAGSRIALIAPAGPLRSPAEFERAVENVRVMGWEVVPGRHVMDRAGYFAGDDASRRSDLMSALDDDAVDGIWCVRGGYGAMRVLPDIPVELVARVAKPLIGFSDITALHALWYRAGVQSFHGPTARGELTDFSRDCLLDALRGERYALDASMADVLVQGSAIGPLVGGNLALLASLSGTPFQFDCRGAIVFLEDVGEAVYRLDRMLTQLRLAGTLREASALVFGQFTNCPDAGEDSGRSVAEVCREFAELCGVPSIANVPIGHIANQWTMTIGARAALDTTALSITINV